jgi:Berberine and berberine like
MRSMIRYVHCQNLCSIQVSGEFCPFWCSRAILTDTKIYSNDAMFDQLPYQTFPGNNYARLKAIQKKYDPNGFFATRTGGFKYT